MKKVLFSLLVIFTCLTTVHAQSERVVQIDSVLFSYIHLKSGNVYTGSIEDNNDSTLVLLDDILGKVTLAQKKVSKVKHIHLNEHLKITLRENLQYTGYIIKADPFSLTLVGNNEHSFNISRKEILEIEILQGNTELSGNPNATRYFFAPSAIPLTKGSGYYHNAYLLSNAASYGFTDHFTFGGGIIIPVLFYITPKVGFKVRENVHVGAGFIAGTTVIPGAFMAGGIPYGLFTVGSMETNFTVGMGYGLMWEEDDFKSTENPIFNLNGMWRINRRLQLVTENWLIPYTNTYEGSNGYLNPNGVWVSEPFSTSTKEIIVAISLGTRIMFNKRSSFDIAPLYIGGSSSSGIVLPYIDFAYKF